MILSVTGYRFDDIFVRETVFVGDIARIALSVGFGAYYLKGTLSVLDTRYQCVDAYTALGLCACVNVIYFRGKLVKMR